MPITVGDNSGVSSAGVSRTDVLAIVAARNEAQRIAATIAALRRAFPQASVWVADDGSIDDTAGIAQRAEAKVVRAGCGGGGRGCGGKGQAMTAAVEAALASIDFFVVNARAYTHARVNDDLRTDDPIAHAHRHTRARDRDETDTLDPIVVLCDGDLGSCAGELSALVDPIERGEADLAVAAFSTRATGGFGIALGFARWAIRRRCRLSTRAPLSGQRAMRASVLCDVLPFAAGYGMEIAMTIDAVRAGRRVIEIDLPLSHRPTGRAFAGFVHRARQLADFVRVYLRRR
jgi:glucosyl-3-phosphoglycerate synthase